MKGNLNAESVAKVWGGQVWSEDDGTGWENVRLITGACAFRVHEWCKDVPTKLTRCECPCHEADHNDGDAGA